LPFASRLRTKTGMASGSLVHLRRSVERLEPFMRTSPYAVPRHLEAHTLPKPARISDKTGTKNQKLGCIHPESLTDPTDCDPYIRFSWSVQRMVRRFVSFSGVQSFATVG
jgi:hypothetical protein